MRNRYVVGFLAVLALCFGGMAIAVGSTGQVTISGQTANAGGTSLVVGPISITTSAPIGSVQLVTLASGDNAITIPTGTTVVMVQLPAANAVATTLEGASSGTAYGITLLPGGGVALFQPASGQTSFYLHAASLESAPTVITFI
jgi:hypothetical protein